MTDRRIPTYQLGMDSAPRERPPMPLREPLQTKRLLGALLASLRDLEAQAAQVSRHALNVDLRACTGALGGTCRAVTKRLHKLVPSMARRQDDEQELPEDFETLADMVQAELEAWESGGRERALEARRERLKEMFGPPRPEGV